MKGAELCAVCQHPCDLSLSVDDEKAVVMVLPDRTTFGGTWPGELTCPACGWVLPVLVSNVEVSKDNQLISADVERLG